MSRRASLHSPFLTSGVDFSTGENARTPLKSIGGNADETVAPPFAWLACSLSAHIRFLWL